MTIATRHPSDPGRAAASGRRSDIDKSHVPTASSGWYDPDGAAWEADATHAYERFRVSTSRPEIRFAAEGPDAGQDGGS